MQARLVSVRSNLLDDYGRHLGKIKFIQVTTTKTLHILIYNCTSTWSDGRKWGVANRGKVKKAELQDTMRTWAEAHSEGQARREADLGPGEGPEQDQEGPEDRCMEEEDPPFLGP
ncbi:hypothetical protein NDU88_005388 [Pleurodeles waltl]|uniref:Uncharacterized protein n=1 Tax=Pleurodeles waltl TaxID=8319 RepID=A0AAV7TVG8_PLEWA|nr:hypothetical protein NDU88_005388 [Pleurodeles waltl]